MTNILAIDIGTASVSAAIAEKEIGGKADVRSVFRYHYDGLSPDNSKLLVNAVCEAFSDSHRFEKDISTVRIGFSSPFFLEKIFSMETHRSNPQDLVSKNEVESFVESIKTKLPQNLEMVSHNIVSSNIDGYEVSEPYGYGGKVLKIGVKVFAISKFLKMRVLELQDNFFPANTVHYFSDSEILSKLAGMEAGKKPFRILDIGGEVSFLDSAEPMFFGIRAIERSISSFFKIGLANSEAMLRKFTYGTLDYAHERALNKIISSELSARREAMQERFKEYGGNVFISGAGADFPAFRNFLNANVKVLSADNFKEHFIYQGALSGGKDAVLTGLILAI